MTSTEKRRKTMAKKKEWAESRKASYAKAAAIVSAVTCPKCGSPLRRNLALTGWWQCGQNGSDGRRLDNSKPACNFQVFAEN